jgi:hypothetical protein
MDEEADQLDRWMNSAKRARRPDYKKLWDRDILCV